MRATNLALSSFIWLLLAKKIGPNVVSAPCCDTLILWFPLVWIPLKTSDRITDIKLYFHPYMCRGDKERLKIMNAQKYIRGSSNTFSEITMIEKFF
jgi:hypothetical protein